MKSHKEGQKLSPTPKKAKKPRFRIEKLEERIAPRHEFGHNRGNKPYCWGNSCCHPKFGCGL